MQLPLDIQGAYYLIHSMSSTADYTQLELTCARHFRAWADKSEAEQVIYLSGIVNEAHLSKHLASRKAVEDLLAEGRYALTTLRAGIIIGSGSASFEIIRDLVEKLPVMIAPKWLNTRCQPIGIRAVIKFLHQSLFHKDTYHQSFDIGGPDILTYKEMLYGYARVRGLRRLILTVPVMSPHISSYWLYFITATSFHLAKALVNSMKVEVVAQDNRIQDILGIYPGDYETALRRSFTAIETHQIPSSWKDSLVSGRFTENISEFIQVPSFGCLTDKREHPVQNREACLDKVWSIGGEKGWYYANWLWRLRGFLDKVVGGVGLRRGRTNPHQISAGDAVDFWRVLDANREQGRLLLFAEMKLPGEAWLEFKVENDRLYQTATFRPKGLLGRLYWYSILPLHFFVFGGLVRKLA